MPLTSRRVAVSAAWAVPAVAFSTAAPASAASHQPPSQVCDPNSLTRPRPHLVKEPEGNQPRVTTIPGERPANCPDVPTGRSSAACQTWRRNTEQRKTEEAAKAAWDAQSNAYLAYKEDDNRWLKENPGCSDVVRPKEAPVQPQPSPEPTAAPTPQPTQPTETQPAVCRPWKKWEIKYLDDVSRRGRTGFASRMRIRIWAEQNSHPGAGYCSTPEENSTEYLLLEIIRETGNPAHIRGQSIRHYRAGVFFEEMLSAPAHPVKPPLTKGTVSHSWRIRVNVPELAKAITPFDKSGAHLDVQGNAAGGKITNWLRLNGDRLVSTDGDPLY